MFHEPEIEIKTEFQDTDYESSYIQMEEDAEQIIDQSLASIKQETRLTRRLKRNRGEVYVTSSGKIKKGKVCRELGECRKRCRDRVEFADQKQISEKYWNLGKHKLRVEYLNSLIEEIPKKSISLKANAARQRERTHVYNYFLDINGSRINVCKKCFLTTFDENEQIIRTVSRRSDHNARINKKKDANAVEDDTKTNEEIFNHINSFPKYLHSDLTIAKMHQLYLKAHREQKISLKFYKETFAKTGLQIMQKQKVRCCQHCKKSKKERIIKTERLEQVQQMSNNHGLTVELEDHILGQ